MTKLDRALESIDRFSSQGDLTQRISDLEAKMVGKNRPQTTALLSEEGIDNSTVEAALIVKSLAGQINVVIHAVGILTSLPYILEPDERILSLSLGAGNTGREFDLETDRRVAEFKFIHWRGGAESIRQNSVFIDLFKLIDHDSARKRCLYVVGKAEPMRFLNGNRAIVSSVLSKNQAVRQRFLDKYGDRYSVVSQYYQDVKTLVEIIDLADLAPAFSNA